MTKQFTEVPQLFKDLRPALVKFMQVLYVKLVTDLSRVRKSHFCLQSMGFNHWIKRGSLSFYAREHGAAPAIVFVAL
jgi:hypothetical protein